jgi:hypothetical protein
MIQRNKMVMATISAVLVIVVIVGASYYLFPSKGSFSSPPLSSEIFALILGTSFAIAIVTAIGIMLLQKRQKEDDV